MSRPSALYLNFKVRFMDPTRERLFDVLSEVFELTVFGPGHSSINVLEHGIDEFVSKNGPFDFVICDEYILQEFDLDGLEKNRFKYHACSFNPRELIRALDWRRYYEANPGRRIITLMQSDYYNFTQRHIERLEKYGDYFITWGNELILSKKELNEKSIPTKGVNKSIYEKWNDNYHDFSEKYKSRIISCPQFISKKEGSNKTLLKRSYKWACLGADYNSRVIVREILDKAGFKRPGKWMPLAFSLAEKTGFNMHNKYWTLNAIQYGFRQALRSSRYCFTCGSILRWPIRKFFEIPVNGAVLVCEEPKGFEELGFINGENAVLTTAENILDANHMLSTNVTHAQEIASAGHTMVIEQHSVEARVNQISSAISRIKQDSFNGARWNKGKFELM